MKKRKGSDTFADYTIVNVNFSYIGDIFKEYTEKKTILNIRDNEAPNTKLEKTSRMIFKNYKNNLFDFDRDFKKFKDDIKASIFGITYDRMNYTGIDIRTKDMNDFDPELCRFYIRESDLSMDEIKKEFLNNLEIDYTEVIFKKKV